MIHSLSGTIISKTTSAVVVECGGVGFYVMIPASVYAYIPETGEAGMLYTHMNVKEDSIELYGFATQGQQETFRMLIAVSGVGPKVALSILSLLGGEQIALAIAAGDYRAFTQCSGVGPKLAQRIVLELKDKVGSLGGSEFDGIASVVAAANSTASDAVAALVSLGFSQSVAASAVARLPQNDTVEQLIAAALHELGKQK